jgi:replication-associated recombination protein RarA
MSKKFWAVDNGEWRVVEGAIREDLDPGLYELTVREQMMGPPLITLNEMAPVTDKLLPLPDSLCEYIVTSIEKFWRNERKYRDMGLIHKRGLLLEGAPGTGKTAICMLVGQAIGKKGGAAVFTPPKTNIAALPGILQSIREAQPEMPIINIIEDIDKHRRQLDAILPMLDGENQIANIMHIATTNFRAKLDPRLTRPSRFDEVLTVRPPVKKTRDAYLRAVIPSGGLPEDLMQNVVRHGKGLNFANLKELAVCVYVKEEDPVKTVVRLKAQSENQSVGFKDEDDEEED